jgi:hypothetical protein
MNRVLALVPLFVILAGCGSGGSSSPGPSGGASVTPTQAPAVLAGFTEVKAPDFELQMPKNWKVIDFTDAEMDKKIEDMAKNDPEMGKMLPQLKVMASQGQFKFFAFDLDKTEDGFTDNLNVIVQEAKNVSLDQLVKLNKDQLAQMAGRTPDESRTKGRNADLGVLRWGQKTQQQDLRFHTVLAANATKVFTFTFTCNAKHDAAFSKTVEQVLPTITLK